MSCNVFYLTKAIEVGSDEDKNIVPELPDGTPFIGYIHEGMYLLGTCCDIDGFIPLNMEELQSECDKREILFEDVLVWSVGECPHIAINENEVSEVLGDEIEELPENE